MELLKNATILISCGLAYALAGCSSMTGKATEDDPPIAIVVHGGAGTIRPEEMAPELEEQYRNVLKQAIDTGYAVLEKGGSSCDAVVAAIVLMEDSPLFNAGKGAVMTAAGTHELDASIMSGEDLNAGAVAGVTTVKNPILAARAVMEHSPHVMLAGKGADVFAEEQGLGQVGNNYFSTEQRTQQLEKIRRNKTKEFGTVGALALDRSGNLCAGTSTGGMTNKRWGRVGDSPVIGAGTYARNATCGVSCTGHGEYFIRLAAAHEVSALIEHCNLSVEEAAGRVMQKLSDMGATGGMIVMDSLGILLCLSTLPECTEGSER